MKKTDKIIVLVLSIIGAIALIYSLSFHFLMTLKVLSFIIGGLYMFFIIAHLFLCFPLIGLIMLSGQIVDDIKLFKPIKEVSNILHIAIKFIFSIAILFIVYITIPIIATMLFNASFDISEAINLLKLINNN